MRLMKFLRFLLVLVFMTAALPLLAAAPRLQVIFVDVEGGQATLFVGPTGESLLIDTGWPGNNGRDADRIVAAAHAAGVSKLDYVLLTHFHTDHTGGVPQLVGHIPVGAFIDHGPNRESGDAPTEAAWKAYQQVLAERHIRRIVAKPGDVLPLHDFKTTVVSADGELIDHALPGGGAPDQYCAQSEKRAADTTENARSLGVQIEFGPMRLLDLGDLTWDKEMELMCPVNRLGREDVLVVSHHGWNHSSSPALVDAIHPTVAIMDNGATKGGSVEVLDTVQHAPGLQQLWQLHYSEEGGAAHNVAAPFIANLQGTDTGHAIVLTVSGTTIAVRNTRNGETRSYAAHVGGA